MRWKNQLILLLIFLVVGRLISAFPVDNSKLPGGTDVSVHLFRVWHIATEGITKWTFYYNGGHPFLRYYPPLAYWIAGTIGKFIGFLLAYKIVINIFFAASPIAFFYFLKVMGLPKDKIPIALIFFAFIPIYSYYLVDGRYTSLINVVFCLLYWGFLKKMLDERDVKYTLLAGIFLGLSILTHQLTALLIVPSSLIWAFFHYKNLKIFYKFIPIAILALLLSSFWTIPMFLETYSLGKGENYGKFLKTPKPIEFQREITNQAFNPTYGASLFSFSWGTKVLALLLGMTGILCLFSLSTLKDRITQEFLVIAIFFVLVLLTFRFKRILIFLPIPVSVLVSQGVFMLKKNLRKLAMIFLSLVLIASFLSIRPRTYPYPEFPNVLNDGRILFLPFGSAFKESLIGDLRDKYFVLLSPINGYENILGWAAPRGEDIKEYISEYYPEKLQYNALLTDPLLLGVDEYYNLLKVGWVNHIVVRKDRIDLINYFNSSDKFEIKHEGKEFITFNTVPKSTYVELNGDSVEAKVTKEKDGILIEMNCEPGNVTIKETYNRNWKSVINEDEENVKMNGFGFSEFETDEIGYCIVKLNFENPKYYSLFYYISLATWGSIVIFFVRDLLMKKRRRPEQFIRSSFL